VQSVILSGAGIPRTAGTNEFTVSFGGATCTFSVIVAPGASAGFLAKSGQDCNPTTNNGTYQSGTALTSSETVSVDVNVTVTGAYTISTNTVNGYSFSKSGVFTTTGVQTINLEGTGTPVLENYDNFIVTYGYSNCSFYVYVNSGPSDGTLSGGPGSCSPDSLVGHYYKGVDLSDYISYSPQVTVNVDVTTTGTYSISTNTINGYSFSRSGTFYLPGPQDVELAGDGMPIEDGTDNFTVTYNSSTCNFPVTVYDAYGTIGGQSSSGYIWACSPTITPAGTYQKDVPLTSSETATVNVVVDRVGDYTISTNTLNGIYFSKSGTFATTGAKTVVLDGYGTPLLAQPDTFTVSFAYISCYFNVTVIP
jgi:hypothetical protein